MLLHLLELVQMAGLVESSLLESLEAQDEPLKPDFADTWSNSSSSCLWWMLIVASGSHAYIDVTLHCVDSHI